MMFDGDEEKVDDDDDGVEQKKNEYTAGLSLNFPNPSL